jgi:hypothetical protein
LKSAVNASNDWVARKLEMGTAACVGKHDGALQRSGGT